MFRPTALAPAYRVPGTRAQVFISAMNAELDARRVPG